MSLFVNIQPVPFRLLDDLLAQMEANNESLRARQGDKGGPTRPRPQRTVFNADASTYRRPEPAASPRRKGLAAGFITIERYGSSPGERVIPDPLYRWTVSAPGEGGSVTYETVGPASASRLTGSLDAARDEDMTDGDTSQDYPLTVWFEASIMGFDVFPAGGDALIVVSYIYGRVDMATFYGDASDDPPPDIESKEWPLVVNACVVSSAGAREIAVPSGLRARYEASIPDYYVEMPTVRGRLSAYGLRLGAPGEEWRFPGWHTIRRYGMERGSVEDTSVAVTFTENPSGWATPAVFELFKPGEVPQDSTAFMTEFALVNGSPITQPYSEGSGEDLTVFYVPDLRPGALARSVAPETARSFLLSRGLKPPSSVLSTCRIDGRCSSGVIGFNQAFVLPTSAQPELPDSDYVTNKGRPIVIPPSLPQRLPPIPGRDKFDQHVLFAWDWEQPAYCRAQLIALGFAPGDLTP